MSTYRNYRPWNTSASSSNYSSRSDFRSRYSTRDDGSSTSSLSSKTPQFSSITPSTYRPSYSSASGTYRASRSTSAATPTSSSSSSLTTPYVSRYSSLTRDKDKDNEKEKEKEKKELSPPKKLTSRYLGSATSKDLSAETKSKLLSAGYGTPKKEEKGPPITFNTRYKVTPSSTSRGRSRDPSPSVETSSAVPQTALQRLTAARDRSRDPSPASKTSSYTSRISSTREKSRDPSPSAGSRVSALTRLSTRDPSPATRSYTNRDKPAETSTLGRSYSNMGSSRDKPAETSSSTLGRSYSNIGSTRDKPAETGSSTLGRSYSNSVGLSREKSVDTGSNTLGRSYSTSSRDKPTESTNTLGRYSSNISIKDRASRDPSPSVASRRSSITAISSYPRSRDPSPAENRLSSYRLSTSSRDPSPVDTKRYSLNKPLSVREPSPLNTASYRRTSRESSPSESTSKFVAGSGFAGATYNKMYPKTTPVSPNTPTKTDISISYMTSVETRARPSRVRSIPSRISPQKEAPKSPTPPKIPPLPVSLVAPLPPPPPPVKDDTSSSEEESSEETESSEEEVIKPETKIMIQVTTITRATSPTPPGTTPSRSRRMEVAKTIEKVRQRPLQAPPMIDQMTQSDRMDDSTRYSRFGSTSRISTSSSYTPSPTSYSRYTSRYTSGTTTVTEPAEDKSESSDKSEKSDKFNFALPKSKETSPVKSIPVSTRASSVKSLSPLKMVSPRDKLRTPSKSLSKTPDSGKSLPPQSPKAESPSRSPATKIANKDFRKSALNMGPTDRIRTSKSSSSENSSPTIEKTRMQFQNLEKSPSLSERESSVASDDSSSSSTETESQMEQTISVVPPPPPPAVIIVDKEDLISTKVESAKNYLLKTLGNPSFAIRATPSPSLTEDPSWCDKTEYLHLSPSPVVNKCVSPINDDTLTWKSDGSTSNYPTQTSSNKPGFKFSLKHQDSGERPWWLDNDDATEDENTQDTEQDASVLENDVTLTADDQTNAIHEDCKITNGVAEMSLNSQTPEPNSAELPWWKQGPINYLSEKLNGLQRVESGEKAWWFNSDSSGKKSATPTKALNLKWEQETQADVSELQKDDEISGIDYGITSNNAGLPTFPVPSDFDKIDPPLGDRKSPEGLEDSKFGRSSPYDNIPVNGNGLIFQKERNFNATPKMFISRHTNIDDLLGGSSVFSPTSMERTYCLLQELTPDDVRIHNSNSPPKSVIKRNAENDVQHTSNGAVLDDAAIQVYKDGDFGAYLDLESSLAEQSEEIEGLNSSRKNSLVVRTQLSVRVHAIIEKLLTSEGRDLRRALFSLKQIFQEDKDLVHGFVALGGLNCLVQIGNEADQNYQNYILRALGQVMLYVDGMNGVMKHGPTVQWLYMLIASKYRLVVKTALKLLLVFVEYCEGNCYLLVNAIRTVDSARGVLPWTNIMKLLKDYDNADTELLIYATSLINKTLSGLSDQDSFYDESDYLEQQGMESIIQRYMSRTGTDLDLIDQLQLYDAALRFEDGESDEIVRIPDNTVRKTLRYRADNTTERRKSRRHSTGTAPPPIPPPPPPLSAPPMVPPLPLSYMLQQHNQTPDNDSSSSANSGDLNGVFKDCKVRDGGAGVTPGLRRRRERAERQKSFIREQEANSNGVKPAESDNDHGPKIIATHPVILQNGVKDFDNIPSQQPQQYIINQNNRTQSISSQHNGSNNNNNNNHLNNINGTHNSNLNNKSDYNNVTNKMYHNINGITNNGTALNINNNNSNHNTVSKSVILNLDKSTLDYKNNKNLILNQHQNKVDINGNNNTIANNNNYNNNNNNNNNNNHNHNNNNNIYEKHLNGNINQLKMGLNGKHFILNGTESCDNKNVKFHITKPVSRFSTGSLTERPVNGLRSNLNGNSDVPLNGLRTNGISVSGLRSNGHALNGSSTKAPLTNGYLTKNENENDSQKLTNGYTKHESTIKSTENGTTTNGRSNGFVRNCSHTSNGRSNDYSTIKINYVSRQVVRGTAPATVPSSTIHNGNNGLHDFPKTITNTPSIPNIVINGNVSEFNGTDKITNGLDIEKLDCNQETDNEDKKLLMQLKREQTVKDLTQKLSNLPLSPQEEKPNRIAGDLTGLISKAKEELAKSKSKVDVNKTNVENDLKKVEPKKSENELHWEELVKNLNRDLVLCDLDFTDLNEKDESNPAGLKVIGGSSIPPPPPPNGINSNGLPPPPANPPMRPNGMLNGSATKENGSNGDLNGSAKKTKKTVKLFWKEVREDMIPATVDSTIWDELPPANVDTSKLEHLFESRAKDLVTKKQQEINKNKEVIVLDHKRSNAINIAMTKLPPPRAIKAAILKMDSTVVTREGIEKLLNMLPTDEERGKIQEAQVLNPELPLGSAEQFLLTLSSISELSARLKLWAFKLDFENIEKEIAEPLMDLKQGVELLKTNLTFKCILSTLLSVGIYLNGTPVKGFQIEYLAKVPEVKDTVHKHSLLHHLCHMVMESSPNTTDLYSEIGPITRASKADFAELAHNIIYLETECKASWDRLKLISKHDTAPHLQQKLFDFLADCAERIIILDIVHRRVLNRYRKFLLWLGVPQHRIVESRPNEFCRILSEFALEYRTTRERVHQQIEKKANHRERNKTRGKLIIDIAKFKTNGTPNNTVGNKEESKKDAELRQLLGNSAIDGPDSTEINGTFSFRRRRPDVIRSPSITHRDESLTDGDDEILESLVKTATKTATPRPVQRERKRTRNADRKSLRRTLKNGLSDEEKQHIQHLIQGY